MPSERAECADDDSDDGQVVDFASKRRWYGDRIVGRRRLVVDDQPRRRARRRTGAVMSFARSVMMSLCASALLLGGCLADADDEAASLDQAESEIAATPAPICQDIKFDKVEYIPCGFKPNGGIARMKCTSHCTTHQTLHLDTIPSTCEVGLTICSNQMCEPCPY